MSVRFARARWSETGPRPEIHYRKEHKMTMKQTMKAMSFAAMLGIAALSAQVALADDTGLSPLTTDLKKMSNKEGMITKKDFMAMMEKRFDAMDKGKKGMIHMTEATKIFSDKP
jgi:carbohydrate-selective porin OprB